MLHQTDDHFNVYTSGRIIAGNWKKVDATLNEEVCL